MVPNLPEAFIFMKIGPHAQKTLPEILEEKRQQIRDVGYCFWGYGGYTLHPVLTVVPFVRYLESKSLDCFLGAEETPSNAAREIEPSPSTAYSLDKVQWEPIPKGLTVTGSKFALVLNSITDHSEKVHLTDYVVAVGRRAGDNASSYLNGRNDKGCVERRWDTDVPGAKTTHISYLARLCPPYAVFLKTIG